MSGTQAFNWFKTEAEFRQLCGDAQSQAKSERAQDFAAQMVIKSKQWGLQTDLSYRQLKWLCELADWIIPEQIYEVETWPWRDHEGKLPGE
jgi:hypothetical protein